MDFAKFKNECKNAPRLREMANFFSSTASGNDGMPLYGEHKADTSLFSNDTDVNLFHKVHSKLRGNFDKHFFSSIPYILEEECRMGSALLNYGVSKSNQKSRFIKMYTLGTAEATMARTISTLAKGKIKTFSCSPTKENEKSFFLHGIPEQSKFFVGPFYEVDHVLFSSNPEYNDFQDGFDVIVEDTTFQMYGKNRGEQINYVKDKLVEDGIFIFVEKFKSDSIEKYIQRESQKDKLFKSRYFSSDDIESKKTDILSIMNNFEVSVPNFCEDLSKSFKHAVMTWNSGNFYTIMASNSEISLKELVSNLIPPCIPPIFCYEKLPKILIGLEGVQIEFKSSDEKSVLYNELVHI